MFLKFVSCVSKLSYNYNVNLFMLFVAAENRQESFSKTLNSNFVISNPGWIVNQDK